MVQRDVLLGKIIFFCLRVRENKISSTYIYVARSNFHERLTTVAALLLFKVSGLSLSLKYGGLTRFILPEFHIYIVFATDDSPFKMALQNHQSTMHHKLLSFKLAIKLKQKKVVFSKIFITHRILEQQSYISSNKL